MTLAADRTLSIIGSTRYFNVKDAPYNAVGDGVNDDIEEITAAITAACAGRGGHIHLPVGLYKVSGEITIPCSGVTLVGDGPHATVIQTSSTTANVILFGPGSTLSPCGGVHDMSINSSVTRTAGAAIVVQNCGSGTLDNLRIHTTGGDGVFFSPGAGLSVVFFLTNFDITITGAFTGIKVNGSNDQFIANGWIQGNQAAGSKGVSVTATGGVFFSDIDIVLFDHGMVVEPGNGQVVTSLDMKNVLADSNNLTGFRFAPTGTGIISGTTCTSCWAASNGAASTSGRGVYISGGATYQFTSMRNGNNGGHGFEIAGGTNIRITGGWFAGNSAAASGSYDGVAVTAATSRFSLVGVTSGGSPSLQRYGLSVVAGSDEYFVVANDFTGNLTAGLLNTPGLAASRLALANLPLVAAGESYSGTGGCAANNFVATLNGGTSPTCAQPAHSGLSGLTSGDDHTQYLLLAGRAAGQTVVGIADAIQLRARGFATQTTPIFTAEKSDGTDVLNVYATGVIEAPLLHNTGGTSATQAISSGTYTPTITGVTNVDASTAYLAQWLRVGNVVTVSSKVDIDATAAGTTDFGISLPVASNFTAGQHCAGIATIYGVSAPAGTVLADSANDRANVNIIAADGVNRPVVFQFTYTVL